MLNKDLARQMGFDPLNSLYLGRRCWTIFRWLVTTTVFIFMFFQVLNSPVNFLPFFAVFRNVSA